MNPQYEVVTGSALCEFSVNVQEMMKYGWKPCGGISVINGDSAGGKFFYQAMTKGVTETG